MNKLKKVLFLPAWYPSRVHLSTGSFIRSHAEAINGLISVDVFYVCGDEELKKLYSFEKSIINGVGTYILFYRKSKSKYFISQIMKGILYFFGQFYGYYQYRKTNPKPIFFHVHVLTRAAILPYTLKMLGGKLNYFITEHWSRYLPQDDSYKGIFRKKLTKSIVKKSKGITAVSENLKYHMNKHGLLHNNFKVISNVAKDVFFNTEILSSKKANHFVHISNFAANCKNVVGILQAFKILQEKGYVFSLKMVGDGDDFELAKQKAAKYNLVNVFFTGFIYGKDVVNAMKEAEALILFSNYETQSVVTIESLKLGIPVIATKVGGIPEIINHTNGILVEPNDVGALSEAIAKIIKQDVVFDSKYIEQEATKKFKASVIAGEFISFYRDGGAFI